LLHSSSVITLIGNPASDDLLLIRRTLCSPPSGNNWNSETSGMVADLQIFSEFEGEHKVRPYICWRDQEKGRTQGSPNEQQPV
ncbi:MAG: hypothetical protein JW793_12910, partial [Acidobacteria bacterium]|nr:hypothetical protein [Acidobacteriota bacterium]